LVQIFYNLITLENHKHGSIGKANMTRLTQKLFCTLPILLPAALYAFSTGPVIQRTGAAVDGGTNCSACHRTFAPANSDPRGSIVINAQPYTPGVKQTITVTINHPTQKRWGFQLIARLASDETLQAGTFSTNDLVRVRCSNTQDAPCNGAAEYAEHNNAPVTAVGAGFTFQIDWTPPATNVGDIHFYAAGNAANGDGTFNGDYIYTTLLFIPAAGPCNLSLKPSVGAVVNSASFANTISSGALISIFGSGFNLAGTKAQPTAQLLANNSFPKAMACAAVEVNGTRVPVTFVGDQQINAQAPANLAAGPATVRVIVNPDTANQVASDPMTVTAATVSPAFFQFTKGAAAATATDGTPLGDPTQISGAVAAKPGDMVTFWLTGCGPTTPAVPEGTIVNAQSKVNGTVSLTIGGVSVPATDITYAGLSPKSISGLYQMNVRIPAGLADGNATVAAQVNGTATQSGLAIPIKN
jgi:uncharacterized protein (TIGR03437 family)